MKKRIRNTWNDFCCKKYDAMMGRCYRPSDNSYQSYSSRGIKVCSAWIKDIQNFKDWVNSEVVRLGVTQEEVLGNKKLYTLDRIDTHGHYCPENCRLVNNQVQARNNRTRNTIKIISAEGEEIEI